MKAGPLNSLFAPYAFLNDSVFTTKHGALAAVYGLPGIDPECLADDALETVSQSFHTDLRTLNPDLRHYEYIIKEKGVDLPYHRANELYSVSSYRVILYEPREQARLEDFEATLTSLETVFGPLLKPDRLSREEVFIFLRILSCLRSQDAKRKPLQYTNNLDYWMGEFPIGIDHGQLWIGQKPVAVLTLQELPRQTYAALLYDLLTIECDFILCSEFKRMPADKAADMVTNKQDHFDDTKDFKNRKSAVRAARQRNQQNQQGKKVVADAASIQNIDELGEILKRIRNGGEFLGEYSLTLVLHADSVGQLQRPASEARRIVGAVEGVLERERFPLDPYLAIIPGNAGNNQRRQYVTSLNYADLALIYAPAKGEARNAHLNSGHLVTLETNQKTPFFFNLHDDDVCDFMLFGAKGSGKSFTTNLLLDHAQQYKPFTYVFDIGGSYREMVRSHRAAHLSLADRQRGFAPFALDRTPKNLEFLSSFVHVLLEQNGYKATPQECRAIDKAVVTAKNLSDLDVPESLKDQLYNWTEGGRYGYLFDNQFDTLELAELQCFDFQGVADKVMSPLFFYIFQRAFQVVYDPRYLHRWKLFVGDEIWKPLWKVPVARDFFLEAGKTLRKHNGGIGLTTQSALDLNRVDMLDSLGEMCTTKIFLANPGADKAFYKKVADLNDRESELSSKLIPKRQIFVKTSRYSKVLNVYTDAHSKLRYSNDPNSNLALRAAQEEYGEEEALNKLADEGSRRLAANA